MFLVTALLLAVFPSVAQTTQVATLSHEGTISTYYSANALKDAYAAAADGDIITLSSGSFLPVDIAKNITIRGAGMDIAGNPTIIAGSFYIKNTATETNSVTLEGLNVNGTLTTSSSRPKDVRMVKCYIRSADLYLTNFTIANCMFNYAYMKSGTTGNCINSTFSKLTNYNPTISYTNCALTFSGRGSTDGIGYCGASILKNCIIRSTGNTNDCFYKEATLINCYYFGNATNPFKESQSKTAVKLEADPFANDEWQLTEEAKAICIGDDGTEAGIYGGLLPFDPTPTNPQITKFNVAKKTTADGKLSVDIEVKANN